jgi:hypothetical protein
MTLSVITLRIMTDLLCWVSCTVGVLYAECHLCKCHKLGIYAECRYAECRGALNITIPKVVSNQFYQTRSIVQHCNKFMCVIVAISCSMYCPAWPQRPSLAKRSSPIPHVIIEIIVFTQWEQTCTARASMACTRSFDMGLASAEGKQLECFKCTQIPFL